MAVPRAPVGLALAAAALALSCTFLVQFEDVAGGACDGGLCGPDAGLDAVVDSAASGDVVVHDAGPRPDRYAPCYGLATGSYCGNDGLNAYAGSPDDLVLCVDGGIGKDTACDAGCVHMPDPFPDACNPCVGLGDGSYCGRLLPGFPAQNADMLVKCTGGHVAQTTPCADGCLSADAGSQCYP